MTRASTIPAGRRNVINAAQIGRAREIREADRDVMVVWGSIKINFPCHPRNPINAPPPGKAIARR
jgi:hypothetical protein